jgi:hypothetical protein
MLNDMSLPSPFSTSWWPLTPADALMCLKSSESSLYESLISFSLKLCSYFSLKLSSYFSLKLSSVFFSLNESVDVVVLVMVSLSVELSVFVIVFSLKLSSVFLL